MKLIDFGTAEQHANADPSADEPTAKMIDAGSSPFVAPEQLRAERRADVRSDIWALGATLFTLLAGRSPFERACLSETHLAILSCRVPDLSALRPELERPLTAVVERCLARDPQQRFASAKELGAALAPFTNQPPRVSAPCGPARGWGSGRFGAQPATC